MKTHFLIMPLFSFTALLSQPLPGVYTGKLMEQNVVLSLSENGTSITGKLYRTMTDALLFNGTYEKNVLTGSFSSSAEKWQIEGLLADQDLSLTFTAVSDPKRIISVMHKLSANPAYSVKKAFDTFRFDKALLGVWLIGWVEDAQGNPRQMPQFVKGLTYTFYSNGTYKIYGPYIEEAWRKYKIKNVAVPLGNWETQGNVLYRLGPETGKGKDESWNKYLVKGDTLMIFLSREVEYWIKK